MDDNKKKNIFKRIAEWCSLTWLSFVTEVQDRIFMSWKRIIKFIGIVLIPIIYGVVCVVAFWNPVENIGRAPMAVMNQDDAVVLVKDFQDKTYKVGALAAIDGEKDINKLKDKLGFNEQYFNKYGKDLIDKYGEPIKISEATGAITINRHYIENKETKDRVNAFLWSNVKNGENLQLNTGNGQTVTFSNDSPTFDMEVTSVWDMIKGAFVPKEDESVKDTDYKFETPKFSNGMALTNMSYINDDKEIDNQWHKTKYYAQIKIPGSFTENAFKYVGDMLADPNNDDIDDVVNQIQSIDVWTTFERNFIFGYYLNTISNVVDGLVLKALPSLGNTLLLNDFATSMKVSGSQLKSLLGDKELNTDQYLPNGDGSEKIDVNKDYVIANVTGKENISKENEDVYKNYTLFGKVYGKTVDEVGGKFINSFLKVKELIGSPNLIKLIGKITGADINGLIGKIKDIIDDILNPKDKNLAFDSKSTINDALLIQLNKAAYNLVTTGDLSADHKKVIEVINEIWKLLTDKPLIPVDGIRINPLFEEGQVAIEGNAFTENLNKLIANNSDKFMGTKTIEEFIPKVVENIQNNATHGLTKDKLVNLKIQGQEFGQYGMGLGQFFLVIGLYIGCLLQTFIFDRAKRLAKAKWSNWYVSKWMLMAMIATFQVTAQVWVAYAVGWHQIGLEGMLYVWLWLWFADMIFVTILQGLWFVVKDEAIGRFMAVLVMVGSLTAGGGTFPAFTQFAFFKGLGVIVPFTYVLNGFGEITYGVSIFGTQDYTTSYILTQFGIMWIYFFVFFSLGFWVGGRNRMKDMDYGSHYAFAVAHAMRELGRDVSQFQIVKRTKRNGKPVYKYNWKALEEGFDPELFFKCREMYKFEGQFKWWARKPHDFVQKPNYSDEDSITRNE